MTSRLGNWSENIMDGAKYISSESEKLVYGENPSEGFQVAATKLLGQLNQLYNDSAKKDSKIRILDLGIGSGLFGVALVKKLHEDQDGYDFKRIEIVGVDSDKAMLENAGANLEEYEDETVSFSPVEKRVEEYVASERPSKDSEKFDAVFCFSILHLLEEPIKLLETLQQQYLADKHLICISETHGDIAPWSNAYDKWGYDIQLHSELNNDDEQRVNWLRFIIQYQEICDEFGFRYTQYSSASNISVYRDLLHERGFEHCENISQTFEVQTTPTKWIESIKAASESTPQFSTFPDKGHFDGIVNIYPQYENADNMIKVYRDRIEELHNDIFKNEPNTFKTRHIWNIEVFKMADDQKTHLDKPCHCGFSGWSVVQRSHELLKNYIHFPETIMMINPQAEGKELEDRKNHIRNLIIQDTRFLVDNQIIKDPLYIVTLYWSVKEKKYRYDLPMLVSTKESGTKMQALKVFCSYSLITDLLQEKQSESDSDTGVKKISSFLFKAFPDKIILETRLGDAVDVDIKFFQTGKLEKVKFIIPRDNREKLRESFDVLWPKIEEKIQKLEPDTENKTNYLLDLEEVEEVIASLSNEDKKDFKKELETWKSSVQKSVKDLRKKFINLVDNLKTIYRRNTAWASLLSELDEGVHDSTFYSLFASVVWFGDDNCFYHIPSIDTWQLRENPSAKDAKSSNNDKSSNNVESSNNAESSNNDEPSNNAKSYREEAVGGYIVLGGNSTRFRWDTLREVMLLKNRIYMIDEEKHYQAEAIKKSATAAIAAVVNRNGSHNIGSHVLSAVTSNYTDKDEDNRLFSYIQRRMEFVAYIASSTPLWTYGTLFYRELWKSFIEQENLLRFIAQAEGLSYGLSERLSEIKLNAWYRKEKDDKVYEDSKIIDSEFKRDFQVGIPGGIIGFHAFYTILENVIRNSAKHSWVQSDKKPDDNLEINLQVTDNDRKDYYLVEVWDNVSQVVIPEDAKSGDGQNEDDQTSKSETLDEKINGFFCKSFMDEFGSLKQDHWGLAEMKICAGFLAQRDMMDVAKETDYEDEIDSDKESTTLFNKETGSGIIKAIPVKLKLGSKMENDKKTNILVGTDIEYLGYQFCIKKPKIALFVGFNVDKEAVKEYGSDGIYFEDSLTDKQHFVYEYIVINDKDVDNSPECPGNHSPSIEHLTTNIYCYFLSNLGEKDKGPDRSQKCTDILEILEKLPLRTIIVSDRMYGIISEYPTKAEKDPVAKRILVLESTSPIVSSFNKYEAKLVNKLRIGWMRRVKKDLPNQIRVYLNTSGSEQDGSGKRRYLEAVYNRYAVPYIMNKTSTKNEDDIPTFDKIVTDELYADDLAKNTINAIVSFWENQPQKKELSKALREAVSNALEKLFLVHSDGYGMKSGADGDSDDEVSTPETPSPDTFKITSDFIIETSCDKEAKCHLYLNKHTTDLSERAQKAWYKEALSGSQVTYHSLLEDKEPISFQESLLNVVESSLYKILIIDERIAGYFSKKKASNRLPEMGLYVANRIQFANNSFNVSDSRYVKDVENKGNNEITIYYLNSPGENKAVTDKPAIAIVHQSLLDKFKKDDLKSFLTWLRKNVTYVFITSGRGDPRLEKGNIDRKMGRTSSHHGLGDPRLEKGNIDSTLKLYAKYIPYGNVEYCIKKEFPDKTLLVRMLTSI